MMKKPKQTKPHIFRKDGFWWVLMPSGAMHMYRYLPPFDPLYAPLWGRAKRSSSNYTHGAPK